MDSIQISPSSSLTSQIIHHVSFSNSLTSITTLSNVSNSYSGPSIVNLSSKSFIDDVFIQFEKGNFCPLFHIYESISVLSRKNTYSPDKDSPIQKNIYCSSKSNNDLLLNMDTVEKVHTWIANISSAYITKLNPQQFSELLDKILKIDWTLFSNSFSQTYIEFIANLVTAYPVYISQCLRMLVESLQYRNLELFSSAVKELRSPDFELSKMFQKVHDSFIFLFHLVPSCPHFIMPLVFEYFPHKSEPVELQVTYLENILKIALYTPVSRPAILELVFSKIIQIDVEIQIEADELGDEEVEQIQRQVLHSVDESILPTEQQDSSNEFLCDEGINELDNIIIPEKYSEYNLPSDDPNLFEANSHPLFSPSPRKNIPSCYSIITSGLGIIESDMEDNFSDHTVISNYETGDRNLDNDSIMHVKENIAKLDSMLMVMFEFIRTIYGQKSLIFSGLTSLSSSSQQELYLEMLFSFEKIILPTLRSRYTQFLPFYVTSLNESFPDHFLGLLVSKLFGDAPNSSRSSPNVSDTHSNTFSSHTTQKTALPQVIPSTPIASGVDAVKLIASSYIGSYVARAKFLDQSSVQTCIELLLSWCEQYIFYYTSSSTYSLNEDSNSISSFSNMNASSSSALWASSSYLKHTVFYSVAQSIFYIFCFRHRDIFSTNISSRMKMKSSFERLIYCKLNPLSMSDPIIAEEFIKISAKMELFYCKSLLSDRRSKVNGIEFDTFFPFDPFKLKRSGVYIPKDIYLDWSDNFSDAEN